MKSVGAPGRAVDYAAEQRSQRRPVTPDRGRHRLRGTQDEDPQPPPPVGHRDPDRELVGGKNHLLGDERPAGRGTGHSNGFTHCHVARTYLDQRGLLVVSQEQGRGDTWWKLVPHPGQQPDDVVRRKIGQLGQDGGQVDTAPGHAVVAAAGGPAIKAPGTARRGGGSAIGCSLGRAGGPRRRGPGRTGLHPLAHRG